MSTEIETPANRATPKPGGPTCIQCGSPYLVEREPPREVNAGPFTTFFQNHACEDCGRWQCVRTRVDNYPDSPADPPQATEGNEANEDEEGPPPVADEPPPLDGDPVEDPADPADPAQPARPKRSRKR